MAAPDLSQTKNLEAFTTIKGGEVVTTLAPKGVRCSGLPGAMRLPLCFPVFGALAVPSPLRARVRSVPRI